MMKERKKILYLMHVPWGWIKQRPHFLQSYYQLTTMLICIIKNQQLYQRKIC